MTDANNRGDEEAAEKWANELKTATDDFWKYLQSVIKAAQEEFSNTINKAKEESIAAFKKVYEESSALPWDMRWDLEKKKADEYIDYTNSLYEKNTLERKFQDSINDTDSLSAQQKLKQVMEEQCGYLED